MALVPNTYAFNNLSGSVVDQAGGGSFSFGGGDTSGIASEGVSFVYDDPAVTKVVGADGTVMFSAHASRAGKVMMRFQQTSPINAILSEMLRFNRASSANTGQIMIVGGDIQRGDSLNAKLCAIMKHPDVSYAIEGATREWTFEVSYLDAILGAGYPG